MLTRRGWSVVGAAVGLYVGARLLGLVQLAVLAICAGLILLVLPVGALRTPRQRDPRAEGTPAGGVDGRAT
jgi:hypothetical protein